MTTVLNEEIRAIQSTIARLNKYIAIETNQSKKEELKNKVKELNEILNSKLGDCNEY